MKSKRNYYLHRMIKESTPLKIDSKKKIIYIPYGLKIRSNQKNPKRFHKWKNKLQSLGYSFQFCIPE